jgi:hypothetical protein
VQNSQEENDASIGRCRIQETGVCGTIVTGQNNVDTSRWTANWLGFWIGHQSYRVRKGASGVYNAFGLHNELLPGCLQGK